MAAIIKYGILAGILLQMACQPGNAPVDPIGNQTIDATGSWQLTANDSIHIAFGVVEGQDSSRVFICDQTSGGYGCQWASFMADNTLVPDDRNKPSFLVEKLFVNQIRLSTLDHSKSDYSGTYLLKSWPQGSCGFYPVVGNKIGVVEDNCIIGEWYTIVPDPFGGPSTRIYKNYALDGGGYIESEKDDKKITFHWYISTDPDNRLLYEYDFSDSSYPDATYGFICTSTGLALGIQGKSWIRNSLVCY